MGNPLVIGPHDKVIAHALDMDIGNNIMRRSKETERPVWGGNFSVLGESGESLLLLRRFPELFFQISISHIL